MVRPSLCSIALVSSLIMAAVAAPVTHSFAQENNFEREFGLSGNLVDLVSRSDAAIGRAIQTARLAKGTTQKDLANKISETVPIIQDYESGKTLPSADVIAKIERILGAKLRSACSRVLTFELSNL
ncbi:hypothetical protein MD484_g1614, partial [Candolleomyces efflorescens]